MADDDIIEAEHETSLAIPERPAPSTLAVSGASLPSVEDMEPALVEYKKRRQFLLDWLADQFKQGVHYGVPPGCEPRSPDSRQWKHKPSLYDAGARLFLDLFELTETYETDEALWRMNGQKPGTFCRKCTLTRRDGAKAGEGTGIFVVGENKMKENSAVKMADKRARVAAVLAAVPFARELFTQDLEDMGTPGQQLTAWIADQRTPIKGAIDNDEFMPKVCEACLFGKRTLTTNREVQRVSAALEAGCFDWQTGERTETPLPSAVQQPKGAGGPERDGSQPSEDQGKEARRPAPQPDTKPKDKPKRTKEQRIANMRVIVADAMERAHSALTVDQMVQVLVESETDKRSIDDVTHADLDAIGKAMGSYDWATGDKLPEASKDDA